MCVDSFFSPTKTHHTSYAPLLIHDLSKTNITGLTQLPKEQTLFLAIMTVSFRFRGSQGCPHLVSPPSLARRGRLRQTLFASRSGSYSSLSLVRAILSHNTQHTDGFFSLTHFFPGAVPL